MSKARVALVVLGDALLIAAVALLLEIDKLVNGTLIIMAWFSATIGLNLTG
jgi:hypothetical protein